MEGGGRADTMKYIKCKYSVREDFEIQTIIQGFRISTYWYNLFEDGRLLIRRGYPWDGASGWFDSKEIIKASCAHDIFCEMINQELLPSFVQALADENFRMIEKRQNMPKWEQVATYLAVRYHQITKRDKPQEEIFEVL